MAVLESAPTGEPAAKSPPVRPPLAQGWWHQLSGEFDQPYMTELKAFLRQEIDRGKVLYPGTDEVFLALNTTDFDQVKVVTLGQDPYHGPGQAHGLCFSVRPGVAVPPSLVNIYKELEADLGIPRASHGYLLDWAKQGVLMLNAVLTVERGRAGAHQNKGWEQFTDAVIRRLAAARPGLAFVLWGSYAQKKGAFINPKEHLVIKSPHPSPLSAHRGFLGSKPFSRINAYLESQGQTPIHWQLSEPAHKESLH